MRLQIVVAQSGDTVDTFAQRMVVNQKPLDQFLILNGLERNAANSGRRAFQDCSCHECDRAPKIDRQDRRRHAPPTGKLAEIRDLVGRLASRRSARQTRPAPSPRRPATRRQCADQGASGERGPGLPALSDDAGVCVVGSRGARFSIPPVGPAAFIVPPAMDRGSRAELEARGAPRPWRASFVSALALAWPDGHFETFEGRVDGELVLSAAGTAGFGYDPIFIPDGHARSSARWRRAKSTAYPPTARSRSPIGRGRFSSWRGACL